jgi:hypothetical protein
MSRTQLNKQRRTVLKLVASGVAAVPLSSLLAQSQAHAGDLAPLSEDDPAAKGLAYVHDASKSTDQRRKPDQFCKNCNLIRSDAGEWRACQLFPGKGVNENGWCIAWVRRT